MELIDKEKAAQTEFKIRDADSVHVPRYTDDPEPYKRALGAILECVKDSPLMVRAFSAICKIHKIDPDNARESYRHWLDGAE